MAVGGAARLAQYLSGRSLFLDEAFLWLNLSRRSPGELLGRLDYAQGAPLPFLEGEKLLMAGLGDAEWALRLIPLLCGLVALPLAYLVARRCLRPLEVPVAVGLVALAPPLIYYSAEAKQYSLDVAVALALWLGGLCVARARLTAARAGALTAAGAAALWLSDPAVFVVAGVGGTLLAGRRPAPGPAPRAVPGRRGRGLARELRRALRGPREQPGGRAHPGHRSGRLGGRRRRP